MGDPRPGEATVRVENVGGIDSTEVTLDSGVTALAGRNATNRTSFLRAVMAALGGDDVSLKGDAEEGRVELRLDGETHTRTLTRTGDGVVLGGDPYLADGETAELFAFLLESNEARRAVARGDDLRALIMRPVDTEEIAAEIRRLEAERDRVDERLGALDDLADELPDLEAERRRVDEELADAENDLEAVRADIADADAGLDASRDAEAELQDALDDLNDAREELEDVEFRLETERESAESLRGERAEIEDELAALPEPDGDAADLEDRIAGLRERRQQLDATVSRLGTVVEFNEEMLEGTSADVAAALRGEEDASALTADLVADTVTCWTCGEDVARAQIEDTLDRLRDLRQEKRRTRNDLADQIDALTEERDERESLLAERENLERRLERVESELAERTTRVSDLEAERERLRDRVDELGEAAEDLEGEENDVLALHREASRLEYRIESLREDRGELEDRIETVEDRLADRGDLEARRETLQEELVDCRTRIERVERDAVEAFNGHMDAVLEHLDYGNIERVWIERREESVREGREVVDRIAFDLHVVRAAPDGTTYEDTVDHLSESERTVTGLVFALAGYLVHDVHEDVPFLLLDSLEAIDSERIAALVGYLDEYADFLVAALLPEDAAALPAGYDRIEEI